MKHERLEKNIPLPLKVISILYLSVFITVYWRELGWINFLWFSDIALIVTLVSLCLERSYPISMMAIAVLLFEIVWNVDFFSQLLLDKQFLGIGFTAYLFDIEMNPVIKSLSISFHIILPWLLLYLLNKFGYRKTAWQAQTLFAWIVLLVCYFVTPREENINMVFGIPGLDEVIPVSGLGFLFAGMLLLPAIIYYPTHLIMMRLFLKKSR